MGRIKRTYTFEEIVTASVDAVLSVFPKEHRQGLRGPLLADLLVCDVYSVCDRRRTYREAHMSRVIAAGVNDLGPDMLATFNKHGGVVTAEQLREGASTIRVMRLLREDREVEALARLQPERHMKNAHR